MTSNDSYYFNADQLQECRRLGYVDGAHGYPSRVSNYPINSARLAYVEGFNAGRADRPPTVGLVAPELRPSPRQIKRLRHSQLTKLMIFRWYREIGYTAQDAINDMRSPDPLWRNNAYPYTDAQAFQDTINSAFLHYNARTRLYTAYAGANSHDEDGRALGYSYSRRARSARAAYRLLCQHVRQLQRSGSSAERDTE